MFGSSERKYSQDCKTTCLEISEIFLRACTWNFGPHLKFRHSTLCSVSSKHLSGNLMFLCTTQLTKSVPGLEAAHPLKKRKKKNREGVQQKFHSRELTETPVRAQHNNKANKSPWQWRHDPRWSLERPKWRWSLTRFSTREMLPTLQQQVHALTVVRASSTGMQYNQRKRGSCLSSGYATRSSKLTWIDDCRN
jgi:hypothetical protein